MNLLLTIAPFFLQTPPLDDVMIINPQERASDYVSAFEFITTSQPNAIVALNLTDGTSINDVRAISLMPESTLVVVTFGTALVFRIVTIESILSITYQRN